MRDRCTVHVVFTYNLYNTINYNIYRLYDFAQINNMTSNMLILLAGLWTRKKILTNTVAADVAGTDEVQ